MFWNVVCLSFMVLTPVLTAVVKETPGLCSSGEFQCGDGACISLDQACNGKADCIDGRDEQACSGISHVNPLEDLILHRKRRQTSCGRNQWKCRDGTCIGFDGKCDGVVDCPDGSDETFPLCRNMKCQSNWFKCTYGACVDGTAPCNGIKECADDSDELLPRCRNETEEINGQFRCANGQLIPAADRCDGKPDCSDGSDETVRSCAGNTCPGYLFQCAYGACVDEGSDCDNIKECADGSDESDELCNRIATVTTTTSRPQTGKCIVPQHPNNGRYIVAGAGTAVPGSRFPVLSLNVSCNPGYRPRADPTVLCVDGSWSGEYPQCTRFCHLNPHESVTYRCLISGSNSLEGTRTCNTDEPDGTIARPECNRPNYYSPSVLPLMRCSDGNWDFTPTCQPGLVKNGTNITIIVQDGVEVYVSQFQYAGPNVTATHNIQISTNKIQPNTNSQVNTNTHNNRIQIDTNTNKDIQPNTNNTKIHFDTNKGIQSNTNEHVFTTVGPITNELDEGRKDYDLDSGDWRKGSNNKNNFNFFFNANHSKIQVNAPDSKIYFKD